MTYKMDFTTLYSRPNIFNILFANKFFSFFSDEYKTWLGPVISKTLLVMLIRYCGGGIIIAVVVGVVFYIYLDIDRAILA